METEKKYVGGWWVWIVFLLILTSIAFAALRYAGLVGSTVTERVVFENSFQYKEARKRERAIFQAQLTEIEAKLLTHLEPSTRANLEATASAIRVQLAGSK